MIKYRRIEEGHAVRMEEGRLAFKFLKDERTVGRNLGRPRHRWEDNIGVNTRN